MPRKASGLIREVFPHIYLLSASADALEKGETIELGSAYSFLASMLFTAFALEAYLNEVGVEKITNWKTLERKRSPKQKLLLLCESENYRPDLSRRPFQTFVRSFEFRDLVVHAKPEKIEQNQIDFTATGRPKLPDSKWLEKCTFQNAELFLGDTEEMIKILHQELKVETISNFSPEHTSWWQSLD